MLFSIIIVLLYLKYQIVVMLCYLMYKIILVASALWYTQYTEYSYIMV